MSSRRIFFLSILIYGLIIASIWTVDNDLIILAMPLIIYLGAVVIYQPQSLKVKINRAISHDFIKPGGEVEVTLTITNTGSDLDEVCIQDTIPHGLHLVNGMPTVVTSLPHNTSHTYSYTVTAIRGSYQFSRIVVQAADHFGMVTKRQTFNNPKNLTVLPDFDKIRSVPIRPTRTRGFAGSIPSRQAGSGTAFYGVREYQSGDPQQWLNWRLSARHQDRLYSNEFEQDRIADVGIILDARKRTNVDRINGSIFEYSIQATASLADMFLNDGNRVALMIYGRGLERTYPGYGKYQREKILRALAYAQVGDSMVFDSFDYLPTRFFPAKSQIVLVSPLCNDDPKILSRIKSRGYNILVVSPDPIAFEQSLLPNSSTIKISSRIARAQRVLSIRSLQRVGIPVVDWNTHMKLDNAIQSSNRRLGRGYL